MCFVCCFFNRVFFFFPLIKLFFPNRQAHELTERTTADQALAIKEPLSQVNRRWDELLRGMVERQRQLEQALLRLGQFQHALTELLKWITTANHTLEHDLKPIPGDPQALEVELAKLKVSFLLPHSGGLRNGAIAQGGYR